MKNKLALVLILLAMFAVGCKLSSLLPGSGGGKTETGAGGGTATGGSDPRADIVAASKKLIDLKSFSAKMDGMGQSEIKSQVDYQAPDRYHIQYLGGTGAGMEMIVIGDQMYMKSAGSEKWSKMPGNSASSIPTLRDSFTDEGLKSLTDVKYEGADNLDGKPALVYSYKNVTPKGGYPFTCKIWVGRDSGLPM